MAALVEKDGLYELIKATIEQNGGFSMPKSLSAEQVSGPDVVQLEIDYFPGRGRATTQMEKMRFNYNGMERGLLHDKNTLVIKEVELKKGAPSGQVNYAVRRLFAEGLIDAVVIESIQNETWKQILLAANWQRSAVRPENLYMTQEHLRGGRRRKSRRSRSKRRATKRRS
jgi:hypothetical protein